MMNCRPAAAATTGTTDPTRKVSLDMETTGNKGRTDDESKLARLRGNLEILERRLKDVLFSVERLNAEVYEIKEEGQATVREIQALEEKAYEAKVEAAKSESAVEALMRVSLENGDNDFITRCRARGFGFEGQNLIVQYLSGTGKIGRGEKVHAVRLTKVIGVIDEEAERGKTAAVFPSGTTLTFGALFLKLRDLNKGLPVYTSATACCSGNGQFTADVIEEKPDSFEAVTCNRCRKIYSLDK